MDEARDPSVPREKLIALVDLLVKIPADQLEKASDAFLAGLVLAAMDVAATEWRLTHDGITTIDDVNGYTHMLMGMTQNLSPTLQSAIISQVTLHSIALRHSIVRQSMLPTTPTQGRHNFGEQILHLIGVSLCQAGMSAELLVDHSRDAQLEWLKQVSAMSQAVYHAAKGMTAVLGAAPPTAFTDTDEDAPEAPSEPQEAPEPAENPA